jgi:hypothetical protein
LATGNHPNAISAIATILLPTPYLELSGKLAVYRFKGYAYASTALLPKFHLRIHDKMREIAEYGRCNMNVGSPAITSITVSRLARWKLAGNWRRSNIDGSRSLSTASVRGDAKRTSERQGSPGQPD